LHSISFCRQVEKRNSITRPAGNFRYPAAVLTVQLLRKGFLPEGGAFLPEVWSSCRCGGPPCPAGNHIPAAGKVTQQQDTKTTGRTGDNAAGSMVMRVLNYFRS